jgi:hypothetical protein
MWVSANSPVAVLILPEHWIISVIARSLRSSLRSSPLAAPVNRELAFKILNWALLALCSANLSRRVQRRHFWFPLGFLFAKMEAAYNVFWCNPGNQNVKSTSCVESKRCEQRGRRLWKRRALRWIISLFAMFLSLTCDHHGIGNRCMRFPAWSLASLSGFLENGKGILRSSHKKVIEFIMSWKYVSICKNCGDCFIGAERKINTLANWDSNTSENTENSLSNQRGAAWIITVTPIWTSWQSSLWLYLRAV